MWLQMMGHLHIPVRRHLESLLLRPQQMTSSFPLGTRFETSLEPKEHMQQEVELESDLDQNRPWRVRTERYTSKVQGQEVVHLSSLEQSLALTIWAVLLSSHCVGAQVEHYWEVVPRSWEDEASATYILVGNMVAIRENDGP